MLVLSRRLREVVLIGDDIRVTVIEIDGRGKVKLGIDAPPDVEIWRAELMEDESDEH